jgi:O-antigen ligase
MVRTSQAYADDWQGNQATAADLSGEYLRVSTLRKVVLWTVGGYLVLNSGFEMVRIPPVGAGVPVGEFVLIICLLTISLRVILPKMATEAWIFPVLVWWGLSLTRCLIDVRVGGAWAFRDASQAIESLYLVVGFWLVRGVGDLQYFLRWLRRLLIVLSFYGLLMPFSNTLQAISPKLPGVASGANSLFFQRVNSPFMLLWCACWLLIDRPPNPRSTKVRVLFALFLVTFSTAYAQGRTGYISVLAVGLVLTLVKVKAATKWAGILFFGVVIIGLISVSGLQLKGGRGHVISLDFIAQHFESISGSAESEDVEGSARGVPQRIGWWRHISSQMEESPRNMIFGLGYGIPLTDLISNSGAPVREPHNSYISVAARLGISGILVWILMQASLYFSWWRSYQLCRRMQWIDDQNNLLQLLLFCILIAVVSFGEDGFEKPFNAIPYYFFFGVVLRYGRHLRQTVLGRTTVTAE